MPSASHGAVAGHVATTATPALPSESSRASLASSPSSTATPHPLRSVDTVSTGASSSEQLAPSPAPPSPPTQRPRLLPRLSLPIHLPLRNRNRNVADFHILPDEPHKKYSAGEHVRGAVVLAVVKPLRITHLTVCLQGIVRVQKDPTSTSFMSRRSGAVAVPQGSSDRPRYHGQGLASIFQDEQVLCGEGRLEARKYEFHFDLLFPEKRLPSSIDFERGTVSYVITATLTRPTSIAPTSVCDRKVVLVQQVDIGLLQPPRPWTTFLEPISKRHRRKKATGLEKSSTTHSTTQPDAGDLASEADSAEPSIATEDSTRDHTIDVRSERSGGSSRSVSTAISRSEFAHMSQSGTTLSSPAMQQAVNDKTITATIELLRGGCLPGDTVTARITVQHIKRLKSMTGVIVTLFRQGKINSNPPPKMFSENLTRGEARMAQNDDAYPKSKAGIAGLSLSSTSSVSMFRKDLDQNTAPLFIDPATLQAAVTISVKLPDDAFPTIKGVPGEMISFKYLVEVIVDLGGRLSNHLQGGTSAGLGRSGFEQNNVIHGPKRGTDIVDTAPLRRKKGVISVSMETVVGTTDSSRRTKREARRYRVLPESDEEDVIRPELGYADESQYASPITNGHAPNGDVPRQLPPNDLWHGSIPAPPRPIPVSHHSFPHLHGPPRLNLSPSNGHAQGAAPCYVPRPQLPNESSMTEKQRVQQAELRLLPSQPPTAGPSGPAGAADEEDIYDALDGTPPQAHAVEGASAPTQEEVAAPAAPHSPYEDKQEMERQRLIREASAPPEVPEDVDHAPDRGGQGRHGAANAEPSAPVLDEDDSYSGYCGHGAGPSGNGRCEQAEQLPAYER